MGNILIVDDDDSIRTVMGQILTSKGHTVTACRSADEAMGALASEEVNLVITDIRMEPTNGMELLEELRKLKPEVPVIMMTAYASVETALDALKIGAYDYLTKPFKVVEFIGIVEKALATAGAARDTGQDAGADEDVYCFGKVIGISAAMLEACRLLELVAPTDAAVLLRGEPGTGRRTVARAVHEKSLRAGNPCVCIPCGPGADAKGDAVPVSEETLREKLAEASGGSVILENVEGLPAFGQELILGVLREKTVPGADGEPEHVDLRVIATGGPGLREAAAEGRFDNDLYKRLGLLSVDVAPLSDRSDDVMPLFWHFLRVEAAQQDGGDVPEVARDARGALQHYVWPGNVQELKEVTRHAYAHAVEGRIVRDSLPEALLGTLSVNGYGGADVDLGENRAASLKAFLRRKGVELTGNIAASQAAPSGSTPAS